MLVNRIIGRSGVEKMETKVKAAVIFCVTLSYTKCMISILLLRDLTKDI